MAGVIPDGPALHAGLQPLDIVVSFAGQTIRTPEEFHQQTQATEAGKPIELIVCAEKKVGFVGSCRQEKRRFYRAYRKRLSATAQRTAR